jgi:hypothetical protein
VCERERERKRERERERENNGTLGEEIMSSLGGVRKDFQTEMRGIEVESSREDYNMSKGRYWEVSILYGKKQMFHLIGTYANQRDLVRDKIRKAGSGPATEGLRCQTRSAVFSQ